MTFVKPPAAMISNVLVQYVLKLDLKIQSILIFDGTAVDITDSNNHTETYIPQCAFLNAFDVIQSS